ncbi:MAG TPA: SRPBCC family protein [Chthoniobacteraceae bacterium]|nr:SRPBCC family protein [Chthoniobacteraceae bacterium]
MHTATSIHIKAPRETIFAMVSDLGRWPEWLPHYRSVQFRGAGPRGQIVEMAAKRSGIPIVWTSEFWTDPRALELHFLHLARWTRGMKVIWTLTPTRDGTRVEIVHDLAFRVPLLAGLAEPIISGFFIEHVAGQTLATFKALLENESTQDTERHEKEPVLKTP